MLTFSAKNQNPNSILKFLHFTKTLFFQKFIYNIHTNKHNTNFLHSISHYKKFLYTKLLKKLKNLTSQKNKKTKTKNISHQIYKTKKINNKINYKNQKTPI